MPEEAFVLRGEDRIDHVPRHFVQSQLAAEALRDARFAQRDSVSIEQRNALHRRTQQRRRERHKVKANFQRNYQYRQRQENRQRLCSRFSARAPSLQRLRADMHTLGESEPFRMVHLLNFR